MTDAELEAAGRYYVKRLLYYTRKWVRQVQGCTPLEQARLRSPDSHAWKVTKRRFNIGWEDNQRFQRAWRAALADALGKPGS